MSEPRHILPPQTLEYAPRPADREVRVRMERPGAEKGD